MVFVKKGSINTILWIYTLVSTKYKINTQYWVIYNMCGFVNDLYTSHWWCERIYFLTYWISNVVSPSVCTTCIKICSNNWADRKFIFFWVRRISKVVQKISKPFWFWLGEQKTQVETHLSLCNQISVSKQLSKVNNNNNNNNNNNKNIIFMINT